MMRAAALRGACMLFALVCACGGATPTAEDEPRRDAGNDAPTAGTAARQDASTASGTDAGDMTHAPPVSVGPGTAHDAGFDSGASIDGSTPFDAAVPDAGIDSGHDAAVLPITGTTRMRVVSGAGEGTAPSYRLDVTLGMPGPHGAGSSTSYRLRLGAWR
jgi:hypothetical protein